MAFCAKCGAALAEGAGFCASCGASVGAATPVQAAPAAGTAMASNVAGCLAYVLTILTGILFLVIEPYSKDKFVRFHAFQAIFFGVAAVVVSIAMMILSFIIGQLPLIGWLISLLLWIVVVFGLFGLWIFLMYKAYNNERYMLPVIGKFAEQQAG